MQITGSGGNAIIIDGDAAASFAKLKDESVDLVLTDPPYGIDYRSADARFKDARLIGDKSLEWLQPIANECFRVLKANTHIYMFCSDHHIGEFRQALATAGFNVKRSLVWLKNNHGVGDTLGDYGNRTEFVVWGHKGRRLLNPEGVDSKGHLKMRGTNVLQYDKVPSVRRIHMTEKPVGLLRYLIRKSSEPGDLVLDPFAGSGATCEAAVAEGRQCMGFEIDPAMAARAAMRLTEVAA